MTKPPIRPRPAGSSRASSEAWASTANVACVSGQPALFGGCLCGAVRFELDRVPTSATYCHCTRCQRRTGGAWSAQAALGDARVHFLSGEDEVRWWQPPDGFAKGFCATCGAHLFSRRQGEAAPYSVRLGAIDGDHGIRPSTRIHVGSACAWEPIPEDGLPRHEAGA